jgi:hypothetical protein
MRRFRDVVESLRGAGETPVCSPVFFVMLRALRSS